MRTALLIFGIASSLLGARAESSYTLALVSYRNYAPGGVSWRTNSVLEVALDEALDRGNRLFKSEDSRRGELPAQIDRFRNWYLSIPGDDFGSFESKLMADLREKLSDKEVAFLKLTIRPVEKPLELRVVFEGSWARNVKIPLTPLSAWSFVDPGRKNWFRSPFGCAPEALKSDLLHGRLLTPESESALRRATWKPARFHFEIKAPAPGVSGEWRLVEMREFGGDC